MKIRITLLLATILFVLISCDKKENKFKDEIRLGQEPET